MNTRVIAIGLSVFTLLSGKAVAQEAGGGPSGTIRDEVRMSDQDEANAIHTADDDRADRDARQRAAVAKFRTAYAHVGSPRIAVYVNRELSAEVREVRPIAGVSSQFAVARTGGELADARVTGVSQSSAWVGLAPDGSRPMPDEDWLWELEDGFESPFLGAGARLVDRATIVRLAAHGESRDGIEYAALSPKRVETSALVGHADLFVEVLVTRSPRAPAGFRLKAAVKEVRTGRILVTVLDDKSEPSETTQHIVTTDTGYDLVDDDSDPVNGPAQALALRVMEKLARVWK